MASDADPPFASELVAEQPPHLLEEPVTDQPVRPWRPASNEGHGTVAKLRADDIGLIVLLQAPRTPLSDRASWRGSEWAVVGELVAVNHRADATSIVLRVAGNEVRLDLDPSLEVEMPPDSRL